MGWGALLKAAVSLGGRAIKAVAKSAGGAVVHPQQTLKGLGSATKSAAIGGSLGYIGWEKLTTDKSVVGIVSDAVIGEETTQKIGDTVSNIGEGMKEVKDSVTGLTENVNDAITSADSKWNGMSKFLQGICSGNGGNMMGNFFSNIGKGNVSRSESHRTCSGCTTCFWKIRMDGQDSWSCACHDDDRKQCKYERGTCQ